MMLLNHLGKRKHLLQSRWHGNLPIALCLAVVVAVIMASISTAMYYMAGFSRYDLSRSGYEQERKAIVKAAPQKTYDTTSPFTPASLDEFLKDYDSQVHDIRAYNDFRDAVLSDEELGVTHNIAPQ